MQPLWLIGMMGAGKSAVGHSVADVRGVEHVDLDAVIEAEVGQPISEFFAEHGESAFRQREAAAVASISGEVVVSTGGGVVLHEENVQRMRSTGVVVLLDAAIPTLVGRIGDPATRPVLADGPVEERLESLWDLRRPMYQAAADYIVDANQALDDVVAIVRSFGRYHSAPESSVYVGATLPRRLLPPSLGREQAVVVAQPGSLGVARAVMARLESEVDALALIELDDREAAKTVASIETLYGSLASLNVGRHDTIVAVGGGAVTDVAGFAAATWLRGIEWVSVPTTMLGAVDASIGGKTGINVGGKNLVGAFWHASQVSISLGILDALDDDLRREGAAEAIKAGFLFDPTIVSLYRDHGLDAPSSEVVRRAVAIKAAIVFGDFRESGQRALLNFGHTIGHGIETASGMPHGYAIAIGMIAAAEVSARRYDFDADLVRAPLAQLGLPLAAPALDPDDVMPFISRDKKRTANGLRMVLLREIGDPTVELVSDADVAAGLAAVGIG